MMKNIAVGQSGGPSAVINASLYGVIKTAFESEKIEKVYGLYHGIEGLIKGELVNLDYLRGNEEFERLKHTPGAFLGSCRFKLKETDLESIEAIFKNFDKYNIGYFFYIGGNDSMDTVGKLSRYAAEKGIDIKIMGVPKTVDNDLVLTDHTPGYGSAAKYIAASLREVILDSHAYNKPTITIVEMMGRHTGWLTAAAAFSLLDDNHDELMIYLPEVVFNMDKFIEDVKDRLKKVVSLTIAVSEGIRFENGRFVCEGEHEVERDSFGHAALSGCAQVLHHQLEKTIKAKYRTVELNVLQRSAGHFRSLMDFTESITAGEESVKHALSGETAKMVCFNREYDENGNYKIVTSLHDVSQICNKEKYFPLEWMTDDHFVTADFIKYAKPLISGEPEMIMKDGLPYYAKLKVKLESV